MNPHISRRRLLQTGVVSAGGGLVAGYLNKSSGIPRESRNNTSALASSEFIVLAANAAVPSAVQQPSVNWPRICGAGDTVIVTPPAAVYQPLQGPDDLATAAGCQAYRLSSPPSGVVLEGASVTRTSTQVVVGGDVQYTYTDPQSGQKIASLYILLAKYFPSPYPLWEDNISEGDMGSLQGVSYLPAQGYIHLWDSSYQLYWIENDVLYILFAERAIHPDPEVVAALLTVS